MLVCIHECQWNAVVKRSVIQLKNQIFVNYLNLSSRSILDHQNTILIKIHMYMFFYRFQYYNPPQFPENSRKFPERLLEISGEISEILRHPPPMYPFYFNFNLHFLDSVF